ncbi:right-handed parallel beta-helix repeat-containing protein [Candidatus Sumerlaeota bacterium]
MTASSITHGGTRVSRILTICIGWMLLTGVAQVLPGSPVGDPIYVSKTATGLSDGSSWLNAFTSIAAALTIADAGDEIWVAATGVYVENVTLKNQVSLYGGFQGDETQRSDRNWTSNNTIIDGGGSGHVVEGADGAILDGFTIQNGNASGSWPDDAGGGILTYQVSLEIANCIIQNNSATSGGGILFFEGSPSIRNCTIRNNTASVFGGIYGYDSNCFIDDCIVTNNDARAVRINSFAILRNSTIDGNPEGGVNCSGYSRIINCTISNNTGVSNGGGIQSSGSPLITNCTIVNNSATGNGGGMVITSGDAQVLDSWFEGNSANAGGGIRCGGTPTIKRCIFVDNTASYAGAGVYCDDAASIIQSTFYGNNAVDQGGALVQWGPTPSVNSCILWGNSPDQISNTFNVTYSAISGGYSGSGNISQDPQFASPGTKEFDLQSGSPCIDFGDAALPSDSDATRADMGAYHYPQLAAPTIFVSPTSLTLSGLEGETVVDTVLQLSNAGSGVLYYTLIDDGYWLSINPDEGDCAAETDNTTITFNTASLVAGDYSAIITVYDTRASNSPTTIPVALTVTPPNPLIAVNPASLSPTTTFGNDATSDVFDVSNVGNGTLNYAIADDAAWLDIAPISGSSTGEADTISVIYNTAGLTTGTHDAVITVSDPAAGNSPTTIPITLEVYPLTPVIQASPPHLSTIITEGDNASDDMISISNIGEGTLNYTVVDDALWLSASPEAGTSTGESDSITIAYSTAGLSPSNYSAIITVSDPAASNNPTTIPVSLLVNAQPPAIHLSATTLTPSVIETFNPPDDTFVVSNVGGATLNYTIDDNADWLSISPLSGSSSGEGDTITVSYDAATRNVGTYNAMITVSDPAAANNPQTVSVSLTINEWLPEIGLSETELTKTVLEGYPTNSNSFRVSNPAGGTLNYTIVDNISWLSVNPSSGDATGEVDSIDVYYSTSSLAVGTYHATITVSDPNATNNPQGIPVTLNVNNVQPDFSVNTLSIAQFAEYGQSIPNKVFYITNIGVGALSYSISDNAAWLSVLPASGGIAADGRQTIYLNFNAMGLSAGTYSATLTVDVPNAVDGPLQIQVQLIVLTGEPQGPVISLSPPAISRGVTEGGTLSQDHFNLSNTGNELLGYTITDNANWVSVSPSVGGLGAGGTQQLDVNYNVANLEPGSYAANIQVSDPAALNTPQSLTIHLTVSEGALAPPVIQLNRGTISRSLDYGQSLPPESFSIANTGEQTLQYAISDNVNWLEVNPSQGSSTGQPQNHTITFNTSALAPGTHTGRIIVSSGNATNGPQQLDVVLAIGNTPSPIAEFDKSSLARRINQSQSAAAQTFRFCIAGGGAQRYTLGVNQTWLSISNAVGTNSGGWDTVTVNYQTASLPADSYFAEITLASPSGAFSPVILPVSLTINPLAPELRVTFPSGGERLEKGQDYAIKWGSSDYTGNVRVEVYKSGRYDKTLAANEPVEVGASGLIFNPPQEWESD